MSFECSTIRDVFSRFDRVKTWYFFSGWAMDEAIFSFWELPELTIIYVPYTGRDTVNALAEKMIKEDCRDIGILGFSLGGFLGVSLAHLVPDRVAGMVLMGICQGYSLENIEKISLLLKRSQAAYLRAFYERCFLESEIKTRFFSELFSRYVIQDCEGLLQSLVHLGSFRLDLDQLKFSFPMVILHGSEDQIAPIAESSALAFVLGVDFFEIKGGHFLVF